MSTDVREIKKLAIANRGEVAVRIIHACKELGIRSVLLHSEADIKSRAYRHSDETICIGAADVNASYLSIQNTINGILSSGADAVHPGFGFLSENADFAQACADNDIVFVGPKPQTIRDLGDKIRAKEIVTQEGVPTLPGYQGSDQSTDHLVNECDTIGYPVIVKATAGGGGRGMKIIRSRDEAPNLIDSAKREGLSAFGSDSVFLEKYLEKAKHIEVQVFGDLTGQAVHLYERECSAQRRHQKVIEESLASTLTPEMRAKMTEAAVRLAKKVKYVGAGTVEFLVEGEEFYFLEMNTRLQVEHPVTEMVLGVDLVKAQILTMMGRMALWPQDRLRPRGHAIECRIYAEDPYSVGIPSTGTIAFQEYPEGPGRRFDAGFDAGDEVTSFYDSMIAKIIVWDETRSRAILKMLHCLQNTVIFGVQTNIPFLLDLLQHPDFVDGSLTTKFISNSFPEGAKQFELSVDEKKLAEMAYQSVGGLSTNSGSLNSSMSVNSPWLQSWRNV